MNREEDNKTATREDSQLVDFRRTGAIPRKVETSSEYLPPNFHSTIQKINQGLRVCIIMRGLPGSGKSFLAKELAKATVPSNPDDHIISADKFFMRNGRYVYEQNMLKEAHESARLAFCKRASSGYSPLIVDNTNLQLWEMHVYFQVATANGYHIETMIPKTPWSWNVSKLAQKNSHAVPIDKIIVMKEKYDRADSAEIIARSLGITLVTQPKPKNVPPPTKMDPAVATATTLTTATNSHTKVSELISSTSSLDINRNPFKNASEKEVPFSWDEFNKMKMSALAASTTATSNAKTIGNEVFNFFRSTENKKSDQNPVENNDWSPPSQVFEDVWDKPEEKAPEKPKPKENAPPQPQRKHRKNKKSSSSPPNMTRLPHCRSCPKEDSDFARLRELYPNVKDSLLWEYFVVSSFDINWCVDLLCNDNSIDNLSDGGETDDLKCDCSTTTGTDDSDNNGTQAKRVKETEVKKPPQQQTPTKSNRSKGSNNKKTSTEEQLATKFALENSVRIGNEFYPEHVKKVREWKKGQQAGSTIEDQGTSVNNAQDDETDSMIIELSLPQNLVYELDDIFGEGLMSGIDRSLKLPATCLIKASTARQLYADLMENIHSYLEEEKLKNIKIDRDLALLLHEQEKAHKFPNLVHGTSGTFKDIMDTQEQLREYENETRGWQTIEKKETMACKLNKDKLYAAFSSVSKEEIDNIFEAMNRNFKESVEILKDSLSLSSEEREKIDSAIASTSKIAENADEDLEDEAISPEDEELAKRAEDLQSDIDQHFEQYYSLKEKARQYVVRKEFEAAAYYNSMASLHKQFGEDKRHAFVNVLCELRKHSSSELIDLHYFKLQEAKTHLNTFLDMHISRLRDIKTKPFTELDVVTGRGAHSSNGVANMKIMTIKLLRDRNLKYQTVENNAGLLKVRVYQNSFLYEELRQMKAAP